MRLLTEKDVLRLVSLKEVRERMFTTLQTLGDYPESPPRFSMGSEEAALGVMPELGRSIHAVKIVSLAKGKGHQGVLAVFDKEGTLKGLIEAGVITALRTAAVSAAVTQLLHPRPQKIAIVGKGRQAKAHEAAFKEAFPNAEITESLSEADVICTATTTKEALAFPSALQERVHINAIGSCVSDRREIPAHIVNNAAIFCDSKERGLKEAGDLVLANVTDCTSLKELFKNPNHFHFASGITLFKSLGLPCEDLALAELILERAHA